MIENQEIFFQSYDFRRILRVIFKHKWIILGPVVIFLGLSVLYIFWLPREYEAKAMILIRLGPRDVQLPSSVTGEKAWVSISLQREKLNSEVEILKSIDLIRRLVTSLGVDFFDFSLKKPKDLRDKIHIWLRNLLKSGHKKKPTPEQLVDYVKSKLFIGVIPRSYIIYVIYRCPIPNKAIIVLEKVIEIYKQLRKEVLSNIEEHTFFAEQKQIASMELKNVHEELKKLKENTNISDIDLERKLILQKLSEVEYKISEVQAIYEGGKQKLEFLEKKFKDLPSMITYSITTDQNPVVLDLKEQLVNLEVKYTKTLNKFLRSSRFAKDLLAEITTLKKLIKKQKERIKRQETRTANEKKLFINKEITKTKAQIKEAKAQLEVLTALRAYYKKRLEIIDSTEEKMDMLSLKLKLWRKVFLDYHARWEKTRIVNIATSTNMALIQKPALVSNRPLFPRVKVILILSIIIAMCIGGFLTFVFEYIDHTYKHHEDVQRILDLPVLTIIPYDKHLERFLNKI